MEEHLVNMEQEAFCFWSWRPKSFLCVGHGELTLKGATESCHEYLKIWFLKVYCLKSLVAWFMGKIGVFYSTHPHNPLNPPPSINLTPQQPPPPPPPSRKERGNHTHWPPTNYFLVYLQCAYQSSIIFDSAMLLALTIPFMFNISNWDSCLKFFLKIKWTIHF